ncbi:ABC transporter ATP-binding protein [bacterium 1xD42-67]|nr:ABC transporter ATP-binding protein [bacterium 1xD42-67]
MTPILTAESLSVSFTRYGRGLSRVELPGIRDLSLTADPGQVTAVVGSSGSGKSLLAHAVLGILPRNSRMEGTLLYDGAPLSPRRAAALRGREIVLVPQGAGCLDPMMQVGPQIRRGRRGPEVRTQCRQALERYGLGPETETLYPFQLSGGMARRVLIASAVMEGPRLVVADEPTPGLDARAAGRLLSHFRELADQGAGVLFITHDLELALTVAHKVVVLYAGQTVEEVPAEGFRTEKGLAHPYSQALWRAMPRNGFQVLPGLQPEGLDLPEGCAFAPRCPGRRPECGRGQIPYIETDGGRARCLFPGEVSVS